LLEKYPEKHAKIMLVTIIVFNKYDLCSGDKNPQYPINIVITIIKESYKVNKIKIHLFHIEKL